MSWWLPSPAPAQPSQHRVHHLTILTAADVPSARASCVVCGQALLVFYFSFTSVMDNITLHNFTIIVLIVKHLFDIAANCWPLHNFIWNIELRAVSSAAAQQSHLSPAPHQHSDCRRQPTLFAPRTAHTQVVLERRWCNILYWNLTTTTTTTCYTSVEYDNHQTSQYFNIFGG